MKIKDMFQRDIERQIQGVVKIGQDSEEAAVAELDEYVVTKELNGYFSDFFNAYRQGTDKIGVWISGFFGSGKSHFLKILSYLLSGNAYGGKPACSYFEEKLASSQTLARMAEAACASSEAILFNIDAQAETDARNSKDSIVKVFLKVFNRSRGYCQTMPWVAELERKMEAEGVYSAFKDRFRQISGNDWEYAREDIYFEEDAVVQALSETTKMSAGAARDWYLLSEKNCSIDASSFARIVREHIEKKSAEAGKTHTVVFLCDEIGQYIGSDGKLMLNLQTVVESLGTECGGRAWVICTSQQDIDSITNANRDNFSKIIGRFDTRLTLSSSNVDEVIAKRLLAKTSESRALLERIYKEKSAGLKNLITFSQDTPEMKKFQSEKQFADVYPFIPYQFELLQSVFSGIRTHGLSGKHLSQGERSLLNAFQDAASKCSGLDEGILVPFDAFFGTIESFLDHNIKAVISKAEDSSNSEGGVLAPLDISVFKILFMVKYISEKLPANLENLAVLMLDSATVDKLEKKREIDASLRRLEAQKLIVKNGDRFVFLTNEEQDINREIREIKIDSSELLDKAGALAFFCLFGQSRRFKLDDRHEFPFAAMIDDRQLSVKKEDISVQILTPMHSASLNEGEFKALSMAGGNVVIVLPPDEGFLDELEQALQIESYLRLTSGQSSSTVVEDIKTAKARESRQRSERSKELAYKSLAKAEIYINGAKSGIKEKKPSERAFEALKLLAESIYSKIGYIANAFESIDDLKNFAVSPKIPFDFETQKEFNHLAMEEMLHVVARSPSPLAVKTLHEIFGRMPYGWKDLDISGTLLGLLKKQDVSLELAGAAIGAADPNISSFLTRRDQIDKILIKIRVRISPPLLNNAKMIARDVFGRPDAPSGEDSLMACVKELAAAELSLRPESIKELLYEYCLARYPGKSVLENGKKLMEQIARINDIKEFYDYLHEKGDALLDYEEDSQSVRHFFRNQRAIFDKAVNMLSIYEGNRSYILDDAAIKLAGGMESIVRSSSPYADIHKLPALTDVFMKRFLDILEEECKPVLEDINHDLNAVLSDLGKRPFKDKHSPKVRADYAEIIDRLSRVNNIYEAIAMRTESARMKDRFIKLFDAEEASAQRASVSSSDAEELPETFIPSVKKLKTLSAKSLFQGVPAISSKKDIGDFLTILRERLEAQLEDNATIKII
ncbi:MAG: BREX system P-loop protein BrxC [Clostridiales bacterium]|jgi:hypothetical protein|nr:BREX system P-loop protein BrxC [Clostridiales bacterium]